MNVFYQFDHFDRAVKIAFKFGTVFECVSDCG